MDNISNLECVLGLAYTHFGSAPFLTAQLKDILVVHGVKESSINAAFSSLGKKGYLIKTQPHITRNNRRQYYWQVNMQQFHRFPWLGNW